MLPFFATKRYDSAHIGPEQRDKNDMVDAHKNVSSCFKALRSTCDNVRGTPTDDIILVCTIPCEKGSIWFNARSTNEHEKIIAPPSTTKALEKIK